VWAAERVQTGIREPTSRGRERAGPEDRCPVCRAALTGSDVCRRCKADLSGVRTAEAAASRLETAAMLRLADGDIAAATRLLHRSLRLHRTPAAAGLLALLLA
jgi:predicted amidophosphoribosyltransferase